MKKKININECIWGLILGLFVYKLFSLILTKNLATFIHPKMHKYIFFTFIVFAILFLIQIKNIFKGTHAKKIKLGYIIFLLPLILMFTVSTKNTNAQMSNNKIIDTNNVSNNSDTKSTTEDDEDIPNESDPYASNDEDTTNTNTPTTTTNYNTKDGQVFIDTLLSVRNKFDSLIGKKITLTGFVYKEDSFDSNTFVIARLLMSCCAADAQPTGLFCKWDKTSSIKHNQWIKLTGIIEKKMQYNEETKKDEPMAIIKVSNVEPIEEPKDPYIYPY